jgi:hypothetical protein
MSLSVAPSIHAFLEHEAALRALHGAGALYVRPQVYAAPKLPGSHVVVGGWAFFDGEPAIVPEGLHLLVISDEGPDGQPRRVGRDPAAVMALLAPFSTRHLSPCPHVAVRVPPSAIADLHARVAALPEHDPVALAAAIPARKELAAGIPHPADVALIDAGARQINAAILVAGSGAKRFARTIFAATGGVVNGPPDASALEHYIMRMGDIRGWQTRLLFYAGDDTLAGLEIMASLAPHAAALVVAQEGAEPQLSPGLALLARAPRGRDTVVAFVGPTLAAEGWARVAGAPASIVAALDDGTTMDTLKQIAKSVLAGLRSL